MFTVFRSNHTRLGWVASVLLVAALALTACQSASSPTQTVEPTAPTAGETPPMPSVTPLVKVSDQAITDGALTIAAVVSAGPGWIVIHTQKDGAPGPAVGKAPVSAGENNNVKVEVDAAKATEVLYAMLHTDAGSIGTYEFPGADTPVKGDPQMVNPSFKVALEQAMMPEVVVSDQGIKDGSLTIDKVVSAGPGWIVIHMQKDGAPGPAIGHASLAAGENLNVAVQVDDSEVTATVYAMLHTDAGQVGTYEFPGPDAPVSGDSQMVNPSFNVTGEMESSGEDKIKVSAFDSGYNPKELTVKIGTTVRWTNDGAFPHTVTADDGSFDSGNMNKGDTFEFTFTKAGNFPYYCTYHGGSGGVGMAGTVIVAP